MIGAAIFPVTIAALVVYAGTIANVHAAGGNAPLQTASTTVATVTEGGELFQRNCAFCHGRDAGGGESGL